MPNYFQLIRKTTGQAEKFVIIDKEICEHFNVPCHPTQWYLGWYDIVGLYIAIGRTFDEIIKISREEAAREDQYSLRFIALVEWLKEHFTTDAWYQVKTK